MDIIGSGPFGEDKVGCVQVYPDGLGLPRAVTPQTRLLGTNPQFVVLWIRRSLLCGDKYNGSFRTIRSEHRLRETC